MRITLVYTYSFYSLTGAEITCTLTVFSVLYEGVTLTRRESPQKAKTSVEYGGSFRWDVRFIDSTKPITPAVFPRGSRASVDRLIALR